MSLTIEQALQNGLTAHQEGKLQEAERVYRAILKSQPLHPDANHNLGLLAVSINQVAAALPLFKIALEANPKIEQFWLSYIDALIKEQQFEAAKQVIAQGKKNEVAVDKLNSREAQLGSETKNINSTRPSQAQLNRLLEFYQAGRHGDAEKLALTLTEEFPDHRFGWKVLGAILKQTGRISESLIPSQKAVQLSPKDAEAYNNLGITLQELGRLEEAEASFTRAIALSPDYAEAHYNLGITHQEQGRLNEAQASYQQAIALKYDLAEAHNNLGLMLERLDRLDEAEVSLRQAIILKPDYAEAHSNLGFTLTKLGRLDEAEAILRQAIVLKYDLAEAHNNLGLVLTKEDGRLDEAEVSYNRAIALKPDFVASIMNRWQLLFDKKEFDAALRDSDFCNTRESRVSSLETLYMLGRIEEIYQRIEIHSELDDGNLRMAAFSAFISNRQKKKTAHKFCQNPLSFLHFANISFHLGDSDKFVGELIDELSNIKSVWEPHQKTTFKGFQTSSDINLFATPAEKITQLKSIIVDELDAYYSKFRDESCSFIEKWPSAKNLWGWHVVLKQQGYQDSHIHPGGWLSGVIYLKVVPSLGKDEGAIQFSLDGENYSDVTSPKLRYQPESGDMVFFPSSLHHRTIPFETDADRIIISFDLMPEASN